MNDRRGIVPLVLVVVAVIAMAISFPLGISSALSGNGTGALGFQIIFLVGVLVTVASIIVAVLNLIRGNARALSIITIVVAFLPLAAFGMLAAISR